MKQWKQIVVGCAMLIGIGGLMLSTEPVGAINVFDQCAASSDTAVCASKDDSANGMVMRVINTLLIVLGMISVIMVVIGGVRYTISGGNSTHTKEARETIIYSVVGLIVAIMSFTIVNFVVGRF